MKNSLKYNKLLLLPLLLGAASCNGRDMLVDVLINNPCNQTILADADTIRFTVESDSFNKPQVSTFTTSGQGGNGNLNFNLLLPDAKVTVSVLDKNQQLTAVTTFGPMDLSGDKKHTHLILNVAPGKVSEFNQTTPQEGTCGEMSYGRIGHTATTLPNGQVLIIGGEQINSASSSTPIKQTEFYDPATSKFTEGPELPGGARKYHTATLLPDGRVLIAGGIGQFTSGNTTVDTTLNTVFVYDPESGAFSWPENGATNLTNARAHHTATLLSDGRVMFAGGLQNVEGKNVYTDSIEFWNPEKGCFSVEGIKLQKPRAYHSAVAVNNNNDVVFLGGQNESQALSSVEYYHAGSMENGTGELSSPRTMASAILLSDNETILISGGYKNAVNLNPTASTFKSSLKTADLYKFNSTKTLPCGEAMTTERAYHQMSLLPNGTVLITGGRTSNGMPTSSAEIFTVKNSSGICSASSELVSDMTSPRSGHAQTILPGGDIFLVSGQNSGTQTALTAEYYTVPRTEASH